MMWCADPKVGRIIEPTEGKRRVKHVARKGATKKKIASNTSEPASSARVGVKRQQPDKTKRKTKPQTKKFKSGTPVDEFMIDEYNVYDVFGLPLNPTKDVEISRTANERNSDFHIKLKWRNDFNVGPNENIKLGLIEERIKDLDMGREEFKRMFVMHALSSFFAPTANRTADLRIAKCLVDVDEIRTYNWSKYVLDRLCEAMRKYKNGDLDYFTGCVMLLQLVYFHRLKFRNKEVDCSIPLVQHWTDENVKDRVSSETKAVCIGCGCLDTTTYPVSKKLRFVDGQAVEYSKDLMDEVNYKGKEKSSEDDANDFDAGPKVFETMDEIVNIVLSVKNMPGGLFQIYYLSNILFICAREVMVWLHPNFIIHMDDMVSIGSNSEIFCCVIDCWALMLNENERRKKGEPVKFFFNVSQSSDQVSTFFDGVGLVNSPYIIDYHMEFVTLNWKSSKQNVDCGLYVMISMLLFDGSDEFSCDNLKTAPMRRVLRAKICAALVLSDRNDVRSEILDKMKGMRPSRPQLQKEVEQRRKQEMEDLKKEEYAAKRAAKKN
ncbi:Multidrug resistance-associated protein 1 [Bienertia sinuspersici]